MHVAIGSDHAGFELKEAVKTDVVLNAGSSRHTLACIRRGGPR